MNKKINIQKFLKEQDIKVGTYAIIHYGNNIETVYFSKYHMNEKCWFLESPCELRKICDINQEKDFIKYYMQTIILENGVKEADYIKEFINPMIIDGVFYEIENYQCAPYLPSEVDKIRLITERECLLYMLQH